MNTNIKHIARAIFYAYFLLAVVVVVVLSLRELKLTNDIENKPVERSIERQVDSKFVVPVETNYLYGVDLLRELKSGGLVIYFRHFATDHRIVHKDKTRPRHKDITAHELMESCASQRPLSDYGRLQAKSVAMGLEAHNISVQKVLSSPYCRAMEGARIAFGIDPSPKRELIYRTKDFSRKMMSDFIVSILGEKPASGNVFVMAHRPQMDDIQTIGEGDAFVFRPLGNKQFSIIGRVRAEEWHLSIIDPYALGASYLQEESYSQKSDSSGL